MKYILFNLLKICIHFKIIYWMLYPLSLQYQKI